MKSILASLALFFACFATGLGSAWACGADTNCNIGERTYRIKFPAGYDKEAKIGAIIFNHGYRGTASGLMRNKRLSKAISDLGLAFVAPKSARQDWDIPNAPFDGDRVEIEFFDRLKQDLVTKHGIDGNRIMVSGFSAGGMMTWNLACERGDQFAAFAPISGTFWAPIPDSCPSLPANIIHMHGRADTVVPMAGRPILKTRQGDVNKAINLAFASGAFGDWADFETFEGLSCRRSNGASGKLLELCMHKGGHTFKSSWLARAWKEFEWAGAFGDKGNLD